MSSTDGCTQRKPFQNVQKEDWHKMSLMDKWKTSYSGGYVDNRMSKAAEYMSIFYFWLISSIELYCFLYYIIPQYFTDYPQALRLALYFLCIFGYIETVVNWFCTRLCLSTVTGDVKGLTLDSFKSQQKGNVLSWRWCSICDMNQPPRTHHCKVCDKCVLKRDHHCFMTGVCVGFRNQKYFIVLNFYIAIASAAGMIFVALYMWEFSPFESKWDYFLPNTLYNWWFGSLEFIYVLFTIQLYTYWWTGGTAITFVALQMHAVLKGKTSHEDKKSIKIRSTASTRDNIASVFGDYWLLGLFVPTHKWFKQPGNGIDWPHIKGCYVKRTAKS